MSKSATLHLDGSHLTWQVEVGTNLLKASELASIPHTQACGGLAKCSTCRVAIIDGKENCGAPTPEEQALLDQKGLPSNVRLACQTKVLGDIQYKPLIHDDVDARLAIELSDRQQGEQKCLAVLFFDIRSFTNFSQDSLAYDVIHILNRLYNLLGEVVQQHQGKVDNYFGDGMMVLFGENQQTPELACQQAVDCAKAMFDCLQTFNLYLYRHYRTQFDIGIGIDFGEVIVGELGHKDRKHFTALGQIVNTAARIEQACKVLQCRLLISQRVNQRLPTSHQQPEQQSHQLKLKGVADLQSLFSVAVTNPINTI